MSSFVTVMRKEGKDVWREFVKNTLTLVSYHISEDVILIYRVDLDFPGPPLIRIARTVAEKHPSEVLNRLRRIMPAELAETVFRFLYMDLSLRS